MNISHKKRFHGKVSGYSSEFSKEFSASKILSDNGYWCTEKSDSIKNEFVTIDYKDIIVIDHIELIPSENGISAFPKSIRVEISINGDLWKVVHSEKLNDFSEQFYKLDIPLSRLRYLKIVVTESKMIDSKYYSEIGQCNVEISGIRELTASSMAQGGDLINILDNKKETFWESEIQVNQPKKYIQIDLGKVVNVNRIVLGSSESNFPENFIIDTSADNNVWSRLLEEKDFRAEKFCQYFWDFNITPARFIRIEFKNLESDDKKSIKISSIKVFSAISNPSHTHDVGDLVPNSSIFQAGIVRFAKDGEDSTASAVQGSDRRLRDATTIFKGIVQLAEDGDQNSGLVVQASDSRLKEANELNPGIIRLGYDRENKPNVAVQGNDSRLQEASEESFGIVKLCPDGMETEHGVVKGNDSRIKKADTNSPGICMLAKNGESKSGKVVQADDKRLREATTSFKGIVELADDGENLPGVVVQGNDRRLSEATTSAKGIVELAEDGEDAKGVVVQGNDSRIAKATINSMGIVELAEDGEEKVGTVVQGNDSRIKDSTTETKGIVQLAKNGENKASVVVQGNDNRLKDATEVTRGILRFAGDGDSSSLSAVQGNDRRLKDATTTSMGIVELAEDGEEMEGVVVQSSDRRLKDATTISKGIVELAENKEDKPGVAVQGSDDRLKDATEKKKGILRFALNGEVSQFAAVQGNDKRLKDATTTSKGIVELAEDGEDEEGVVVQGNDKRLRVATTSFKGIVELAEDGEDKEGVVVQGNDNRLKESSESTPGIVRLAKNKESKSGIAVQADDIRLKDSRSPLPHTHRYADVKHEYNSHTGTINIKGTKNETFIDITPPSDNSTVIFGSNESKESGSIGIAGVSGISAEEDIYTYGVVGHSKHIGVRGQSAGGKDLKGCGVLGVSRFGAGGVFSSEHSYSIVADGYGNIGSFDNSVNMIGNGDAIYARGTSKFDGQIILNNKHDNKKFPANIIELFEIDDEEFVSPGDLLIVSDAGESILSRSRIEYSKSVIGIVSGNPSFVLNNSDKDKKVYPVTLAGKTLCKIDARNNPVKPGDLIVTSGTPGCGMSGNIDSFNKMGTVVGKALDKLDDGIGLIPVFVAHL